MKKSLLIIVSIVIALQSMVTMAARAQEMCLASVPYAPQPMDQAEVLEARVTLAWQVDCAVSVEVRVNGDSVTTLDAATKAYNIEVQAGANTWQVTAIDAAGNRAASPVWRFERDTEGWLATPQVISTEAVIYRPSTAPVSIDLSAPSVLVTLLCGSLCGGLGLVVVVAWWLGVRAQRRDHQRRWYR